MYFKDFLILYTKILIVSSNIRIRSNYIRRELENFWYKIRKALKSQGRTDPIQTSILEVYKKINI